MNKKVSVLGVVKKQLLLRDLRILLHFKPPDSSLTVFYNRLETLLSTSKMLNIVLGDFNINIVTHSNSKMQQLMSQYKLIIHEPTHISRSLLDHFYINRKALEKLLLEAIQTDSIYYSDHEAVKSKLSLLQRNKVYCLLPQTIVIFFIVEFII